MPRQPKSSPAQMTRQDYFNSVVVTSTWRGQRTYLVPWKPRRRLSWRQAWDFVGYNEPNGHYQHVRKALLQGDPVHPNSLKEYPILAMLVSPPEESVVC